MHLIVFATLREAQATLHLLNAQYLTENVYTYPEGRILISGIGMLAVCHSLTPHLVEATEIFNLGLAGALDDSLELGSVVHIGNASLHLPFPKEIDPFSRQLAEKCYPNIHLEKGASLITSLIPVHDLSFKKELSQKASLVDMEGYGVAYMAQKQGIPCNLVKVVSDFSKEEQTPLLLQNISLFADKLALTLQDQFADRFSSF